MAMAWGFGKMMGSTSGRLDMTLLGNDERDIYEEALQQGFVDAISESDHVKPANPVRKEEDDE